MSLRDQAAKDIQTILHSDFEEIVLTDSAGIEHTVKGKVIRTDITVDPDTGVQVDVPATMITVSLLDLPEEISEEWGVSVIDGMGNALSGQVSSPLFDRTLNFVTFRLEAVE